MKIIDKNTDFYDFYQNVYPDLLFTFDRRDSYLLTKDIICQNLQCDGYYSYKEKKFKQYRKYNYLLLQICHTFWLFQIEVTELTRWHTPKDYNIELIAHWRNFDKPSKLICLDTIRFNYYSFNKPKIEDYINDINHNNYKVLRNLNDYTIYNGNEKIKKHIPLLKATLSHFLDAHEVFMAFEEYFSLEKSSSERREPLGSTDNDKIESHGFDLKISFRGK